MPVPQNLIFYSLPGRAWERRYGGSASNFHGISSRQNKSEIGSPALPGNQLIFMF